MLSHSGRSPPFHDVPPRVSLVKGSRPTQLLLQESARRKTGVPTKTRSRMFTAAFVLVVAAGSKPTSSSR